jgi:hypothetical protein
MTFAMAIITNIGSRGMLPRTICLICLTLMWMESALGLCLGCKIHGPMIRRGWASTDPGIEVCADGACAQPTRPVHNRAPARRTCPEGASLGELAYHFVRGEQTRHADVTEITPRESRRVWSTQSRRISVMRTARQLVADEILTARHHRGTASSPVAIRVRGG